MSRSPSRDDEERLDLGREASEERPRDRPDADMDEAPAKRARVDTTREDKARGKRMFGNILGTLQRFKKDDKSSRGSEAAKKREQLSERIATKLRSETNLHHEIAEKEKELKGLRISTDSSDFVIKHKEATLIARHASLRPTSRFLHTSLPSNAPFIHDGHLLNPAPIPLATGPRREPPHPKAAQPLYFLPKILLPHQQSTLDTRIANIDELITDETAALEAEKENLKKTSTANKARIEELTDRLAELRKQVRPGSERSSGKRTVEDRDQDRDRDRDDCGRIPRDRDQDADEKMESVEPEKDDEREKGVQIKGDDGDVEVEY